MSHQQSPAANTPRAVTNTSEAGLMVASWLRMIPIASAPANQMSARP